MKPQPLLFHDSTLKNIRIGERNITCLQHALKHYYALLLLQDEFEEILVGVQGSPGDNFNFLIKKDTLGRDLRQNKILLRNSYIQNNQRRCNNSERKIHTKLISSLGSPKLKSE